MIVGSGDGGGRKRAARHAGPSTLVFAVRRVAAMGVLLLVVSFLTFMLVHVAPGSPEQTLLGTQQASPELIESIRERHHLDRPVLEQYGLWLASAVQLDLGESIRSGRAVTATIVDRLDLTLLLGAYASLVAMLVGVPLGVAAACRKRSLLDRCTVGLSVLGVSTPAFVAAVFLLYVFAVQFGWFPAYGPGRGLIDQLWHLTLPAIALSLSAIALVVKLTRAAMITVLEQDYIAFARARGVPPAQVIVRHGMRNALVPMITAGGLVLTFMLSGTVLVELPFALPGLGSLLLEAVQNRDVPVLQGAVLVIAAAVVVVSLAVDVLYAAVDPRVRLGGESR